MMDVLMIAVFGCLTILAIAKFCIIGVKSSYRIKKKVFANGHIEYIVEENDGFIWFEIGRSHSNIEECQKEIDALISSDESKRVVKSKIMKNCKNTIFIKR